MIDTEKFIRGCFGAIEIIIFGASTLLTDDDAQIETDLYNPVDGCVATMDCLRFVKDHEDDLRRYMEITNSDELPAGYDFAFSRFDDRTGFQTRGEGPLFKRLDDAAHALGRFYPIAGEDGLICLVDQHEMV